MSPGLPYVDYSELQMGHILTLECSVVKNLFTGVSGPSDTDLALLTVGTACNGPRGIELSTQLPPPGAVVDVIGYPGEPVQKWLKKKLGNINDLARTLETVNTLLPKMTLTISRGTINSCTVTNYITYNVSTVPGMSGSCLLYEGKVIGRSPPPA